MSLSCFRKWPRFQFHICHTDTIVWILRVAHKNDWKPLWNFRWHAHCRAVFANRLEPDVMQRNCMCHIRFQIDCHSLEIWNFKFLIFNGQMQMKTIVTILVSDFHNHLTTPTGLRQLLSFHCFVKTRSLIRWPPNMSVSHHPTLRHDIDYILQEFNHQEHLFKICNIEGLKVNKKRQK